MTQQYYPYPPEPPKKKHTGRNVALIVGGLAVLGFGGCVALVGTTANEVSKAIETGTGSAPGSWVQDQIDSSPADGSKSGILKVGTDIQPGEYKVTGTGFGGYWGRLSCLTGELDCIIANQVVSSGSTSYVTVLPSDVALDVSHLIFEESE